MGGGGGGGFTGTQTDRQQTGCPKLRWSFTLRQQAGVLLLPLFYHWPPASPRITQRHQTAQQAETKHRPVTCATFPASSSTLHLLPLVLREDRLRTGRTWWPGFVVVTRRGALSGPRAVSWYGSQQTTGLPPPPSSSEEPLAWMHHGHVCLQDSVFRRHRSVQQHQFPRTDETTAVHLQGGYPTHQPVSRRPPAPQSPTQGRITHPRLM